MKTVDDIISDLEKFSSDFLLRDWYLGDDGKTERVVKTIEQLAGDVPNVEALNQVCYHKINNSFFDGVEGGHLAAFLIQTAFDHASAKALAVLIRSGLSLSHEQIINIFRKVQVKNMEILINALENRWFDVSVYLPIIDARKSSTEGRSEEPEIFRHVTKKFRTLKEQCLGVIAKHDDSISKTTLPEGLKRKIRYRVEAQSVLEADEVLQRLKDLKDTRLNVVSPFGGFEEGSSEEKDAFERLEAVVEDICKLSPTNVQRVCLEFVHHPLFGITRSNQPNNLLGFLERSLHTESAARCLIKLVNAGQDIPGEEFVSLIYQINKKYLQSFIMALEAKGYVLDCRYYTGLKGLKEQYRCYDSDEAHEKYSLINKALYATKVGSLANMCVDLLAQVEARGEGADLSRLPDNLRARVEHTKAFYDEEVTIAEELMRLEHSG